MRQRLNEIQINNPLLMCIVHLDCIKLHLIYASERILVVPMPLLTCMNNVEEYIRPKNYLTRCKMKTWVLWNEMIGGYASMVTIRIPLNSLI